MVNYEVKSEKELLEERVDSLKKEDETDHAFAKRCGLDPGNFCKFRSNVSGLGPISIQRIAQVCNVNMKWLATGEGDKDNTKDNNIGMVREDMPWEDAPVTQKSIKSKRNEETQKSDSIKDEMIESLRSENEALRSVFTTMDKILPIMQQTLQQNAEILAQNKQLLAFIAARFQKNDANI